MHSSEEAVTKLPRAMPIREAFLRLQDEIAAVKDTELIHINLDIPSLVTATRGRLAGLLVFREPSQREFRTADLSAFDKLEDYALATAYAHSQYRLRSTAPEDLPKLQAQAVEYRDTLYLDACTLHHHHLIDGETLGKVKRSTGYRDTAFELLTLYALLREHWEAIEGKTALTLEEIERAGMVADQLMVALGDKASGQRELDSAILVRRRAYTLLVRAYSQVRRCIQFLRWEEGDFDQIAPSLYAGRCKRVRPVLPAHEVITPGTPLPPNLPNHDVDHLPQDANAVGAAPHPAGNSASLERKSVSPFEHDQVARGPG